MKKNLKKNPFAPALPVLVKVRPSDGAAWDKLVAEVAAIEAKLVDIENLREDNMVGKTGFKNKLIEEALVTLREQEAWKNRMLYKKVKSVPELMKALYALNSKK